MKVTVTKRPREPNVGGSAHWTKNSGQRDINSKIVEKSKIMNLSNCFQFLGLNQNRFKDF